MLEHEGWIVLIHSYVFIIIVFNNLFHYLLLEVMNLVTLVFCCVFFVFLFYIWIFQLVKIRISRFWIEKDIPSSLCCRSVNFFTLCCELVMQTYIYIYKHKRIYKTYMCVYMYTWVHMCERERRTKLSVTVYVTIN